MIVNHIILHVMYLTNYLFFLFYIKQLYIYTIHQLKISFRIQFRIIWRIGCLPKSVPVNQ